MSDKLSYRFPKREKLKSRLLIHQLFQNGNMVDEWPVRCLYAVTAATAQPAITVGVTVSKRYFQAATKRNRVKRLLREAWRLNQHTLKQHLLTSEPTNIALMFIYTGKNIPDYQEVEGKIRIILNRLIEASARDREVDR